MLHLPVILNITYKSIYGLQFKRGFGGFSFFEEHYFSFKNLNPEEFGHNLLTTFIKQYYPNNTGVYLNLPYEASFVREITIPFIEKKKIKEVIRYELESLLPFSINEVIFDYYLYPNIKKNQTRVIAVGSDKPNLIPYLEILKKNNIMVLGIYSPLDALFHLHPYTNQKSCIMLHISSITSLIVVVQNGEWLFSRILPLGYDNLTSQLAEKWGKSSEEGEKIFLNLPSANINHEDAGYLKKQLKISKTQLKFLVESIDKFGSVLGGEIWLTLKSIPDTIDQETKNKIPIILSSDLKNQTILEGILVKKVDQPIISFPYEKTPIATMSKEQTINLGAIMSHTSKGLHFFQKDLKQYLSLGKFLNKIPFYTSLVVAFSLFALSYCIDFYSKSQVLEFLRNENKKIYQKYFGKTINIDNIDIISKAQSQVDKLKRETEIFNIFFRNKTFSEIIIEFNKLFSSHESVEIGSTVYTPKQITFHGKAISSSFVYDIEASVEESLIFDSISCKQRTTPSKGGGKKWKFRCTLNLKYNDVQKDKKIKKGM